MGLFNKLFGKGEDYPPLEPGTPLAKHLDGITQPLENLISETKDSLEVVPADKTTYVFIGKPPKQFGIAWIQNNKVYNLKALADQKGLSPSTLQGVSEELAKAYKGSKEDARYSSQIGDSQLVVTASETLGPDLDQIIGKISV